MKKRRCIGYGNKKGICENMAGDKSEYWCNDCEVIRRKTIRASLEELNTELNAEHEKYLKKNEK